MADGFARTPIPKLCHSPFRTTQLTFLITGLNLVGSFARLLTIADIKKTAGPDYWTHNYSGSFLATACYARRGLSYHFDVIDFVSYLFIYLFSVLTFFQNATPLTVVDRF